MKNFKKRPTFAQVLTLLYLQYDDVLYSRIDFRSSQRIPHHNNYKNKWKQSAVYIGFVRISI